MVRMGDRLGWVVRVRGEGGRYRWVGRMGER